LYWLRGAFRALKNPREREPRKTVHCQEENDGTPIAARPAWGYGTEVVTEKDIDFSRFRDKNLHKGSQMYEIAISFSAPSGLAGSRRDFTFCRLRRHLGEA
jgi:hypothetical protein